MTYKVALNFADGKTFFINMKPSDVLLDAALKQGINIPLDCREGVCGTCQGTCESGNYTLDYVDEETLSAIDLEKRKVLSCQTKVQSDASFYFDFDSTLCSNSQSNLIQSTVTKIELVSADKAILHIRLNNYDQQLDYLPGQYARLKIPGTDIWRAYSFANNPNPENNLQFVIKLIPDGQMGKFLQSCQVGQDIELEAPLGSFYLRQLQQNTVMIAGGTGVSAFLAIFDEIIQSNLPHQSILFYYCVTQEADLCEIERLNYYQQHISNFKYELIVDRATDTWTGNTGRITDHLDLSYIQSNPCDIYLCGPPVMIEAIKNHLDTTNTPVVHLYFEKFISSN